MKYISFLCLNCSNIFLKKATYVKYIYKNNKQIKFCCKKCYGLYKTKAKRKNIDINRVITMYDVDKVGIPTIKKYYKTSQKVITDILVENKIKIRDNKWALYNRPPFKGYRYTDEQKEKIRQKSIQAYKNDPSLRERIRQKTLQQIKEGRMPKSNTSIEKIMSNLLTELGISFEYQKIFGYWCYDFFLPKHNIFIECDGDYWHGNPLFYQKLNLNKTQKNNIKRGKQKDNYAMKRGYKVIRFWETDLKKNFKKIKCFLYDLDCVNLTNNNYKNYADSQTN